jgi:hypothetical protein
MATSVPCWMDCGNSRASPNSAGGGWPYRFSLNAAPGGGGHQPPCCVRNPIPAAMPDDTDSSGRPAEQAWAMKRRHAADESPQPARATSSRSAATCCHGWKLPADRLHKKSRKAQRVLRRIRMPGNVGKATVRHICWLLHRRRRKCGDSSKLYRLTGLYRRWAGVAKSASMQRSCPGSLLQLA